MVLLWSERRGQAVLSKPVPRIGGTSTWGSELTPWIGGTATWGNVSTRWLCFQVDGTLSEQWKSSLWCGRASDGSKLMVLGDSTKAVVGLIILGVTVFGTTIYVGGAIRFSFVQNGCQLNRW